MVNLVVLLSVKVGWAVVRVATVDSMEDRLD